MSKLLLPLAILFLQPAPETGWLEIRTEPNTEVTWDGAIVGTTSDQGRLRLEGLEPGSYEVGLAKEGYLPRSVTAAVAEGANRITVRLLTPAPPPPPEPAPRTVRPRPSRERAPPRTQSPSPATTATPTPAEAAPSASETQEDRPAPTETSTTSPAGAEEGPPSSVSELPEENEVPGRQADRLPEPDASGSSTESAAPARPARDESVAAPETPSGLAGALKNLTLVVVALLSLGLLVILLRRQPSETSEAESEDLPAEPSTGVSVDPTEELSAQVREVPVRPRAEAPAGTPVSAASDPVDSEETDGLLSPAVTAAEQATIASFGLDLPSDETIAPEPAAAEPISDADEPLAPTEGKPEPGAKSAAKSEGRDSDGDSVEGEASSQPPLPLKPLPLKPYSKPILEAKEASASELDAEADLESETAGDAEPGAQITAEPEAELDDGRASAAAPSSKEDGPEAAPSLSEGHGHTPSKMAPESPPESPQLPDATEGSKDSKAESDVLEFELVPELETLLGGGPKAHVKSEEAKPEKPADTPEPPTDRPSCSPASSPRVAWPDAKSPFDPLAPPKAAPKPKAAKPKKAKAPKKSDDLSDRVTRLWPTDD